MPSATPPYSWPEVNYPRRAQLQFQSPVFTKTYEGAGHGFMRAGEAGRKHRNQQARDAGWRRWLELLKKD
jgi:dienelactone hydrolase